jgi:hypothetical protein
MTDLEPTTTNLDRYGNAALPWSRPHDLLAGGAFTAPYSAPSAGPPPCQLYRFTSHTAFGVATAKPDGATRWRFDH